MRRLVVNRRQQERKDAHLRRRTALGGGDRRPPVLACACASWYTPPPLDVMGARRPARSRPWRAGPHREDVSVPSGSVLLGFVLALVPMLIILSQLPAAGAIPLQILAYISVMIVYLSFFLWSLSQLLAAVLDSNRHSRKPILLFTVFITSTPAWLGPLVDIYQPGVSTTNAIIAITPLTHFSIAAEYDYLRSEWFYRNTPFGSLPFTYPGLVSITAGYLLLVMSMQIMRRWLTHNNLTQQEHALKLS